MRKPTVINQYSHLCCAAMKRMIVLWMLLIGWPIAMFAAVQSNTEHTRVHSAEGNEAEASKALFATANVAYSKGDFRSASKSYQALLDQGYESAELHYNLGNAHYRLDEIPEAILHYEKAYKLSPGDEDISVNLRFANQKITDKIEAVPEFFVAKWWKGLMMTFSLKTWSIIAVSTFLGGFLLLIIYLFTTVGWLKRASFYSGVVVLLLALLTLLIAGRQHSYLSNNQQAVVFNGAVHVKGAPGAAQKTLFVIHEGTKVKINSRENEWIEIVLPNGNMGWIESAAVKAI